MKPYVMIAGLVALILCPTLAATPAMAQSQTEWGVGALQAGIGSAIVYPSLMLMPSPDFLFAFGLTASTIDDRSIGLYIKVGSRIADRGNVRFFVGGELEVADRGDTTILFAPILGMNARVIDNFSVIADLHPFEIVADGDTEAYFLDGRLGAAFWF
jgi:hypothetical protein